MARPQYIVTTYGTDGAASAALALLEYPKARIYRTSATRVGDTLTRLAKRKAGAVHICGVGPNDTPERIVAGLKTLKRGKFSVTWYCGRGYMHDWEAKLSGLCSLALVDCGSNAGAVRKHLGMELTKRVRLLVQLGEEYADSTKRRSPEHEFWHDVVHHSASRYFKFGDEEAYIEAIGKLAGSIPMAARDREAVEVFRQASSRAIPLGSSPAMKQLRTNVSRIAPIDEPVLVTGPSGVGKELVAWLLHEGSARAEGPFVPVNCAVLATSADLAHDRLFGHVAGAYTGAKASRIGAFEGADGGTLFLDEVAELPPEVQTQLLRVLEERLITPLGMTTARPVDVRVVAATNQDLPRLVARGRFRLDLYHRLNVLQIRVPPLAERKEDMRAIADSVIRELSSRGYSLHLSREDWRMIREHDWPGNIRQFINLLKRAAYLDLSMSRVIKEESIAMTEAASIAERYSPTGDAISLFCPVRAQLAAPLEEIQKAYIRHVYDLCNGNCSQAARILGVAANTVRKWLDE